MDFTRENFLRWTAEVMGYTLSSSGKYILLPSTRGRITYDPLTDRNDFHALLVKLAEDRGVRSIYTEFSHLLAMKTAWTADVLLLPLSPWSEDADPKQTSLCELLWESKEG